MQPYSRGPTKYLPTALMALCAAGLLGCEGPGVDPLTDSRWPPDGIIPFTTIWRDAGTDYDQDLTDTMLLVITDGDSWSTFLGAIQQSIGLPPELPAVDFSVETVLAVIDKRRPSGGSVEIVGLVSSSGVLDVQTARRAYDSPWGPMPTQASHVVAVPAHAWQSVILSVVDVGSGHD